MADRRPDADDVEEGGRRKQLLPGVAIVVAHAIAMVPLKSEATLLLINCCWLGKTTDERCQFIGG